jgi:hypothetical protein
VSAHGVDDPGKVYNVPPAKETVRSVATESTLSGPSGQEPSPRQVSAIARNWLTVSPFNPERSPLKFVRIRSPNGMREVPFRNPALLTGVEYSFRTAAYPAAPRALRDILFRAAPTIASKLLPKSRTVPGSAAATVEGLTVTLPSSVVALRELPF